MPLIVFLKRWLLPTSLALNIFLGAALLAHVVHGRPGPMPPPDAAGILDDMARVLSPADAKILRQALAPGLAEIDKARRMERSLPQRLQQILGREPFDAEAFRKVLDETQAVRTLINATLPDALSHLSPEGRQRLADWRPPHPPEMHGHGPGGPGGPEGPGGSDTPDGPPPPR
jgi:uncharacterized membrane protein